MSIAAMANAVAPPRPQKWVCHHMRSHSRSMSRESSPASLRGEVVLDEGVDRPRPDVVHGVGVADALRAIGVAHPRHDEPGVTDVAVGGVRHDDGEGDAGSEGLRST